MTELATFIATFIFTSVFWVLLWAAVEERSFGEGRHVYTEWGTKGGDFVAEVEEHNGAFTYRIPEQRT